MLHVLSLFAAEYYCDDGWSLYQDQCIMFNETEKSWPLGRAFCLAAEADLVVINDDEMNQFVTSESVSS